MFICFAPLDVHPCPCSVRISTEYLYSEHALFWQDGCTHIWQREKLIQNMHLNHCVAVPLYRKGSEAYDLYLLQL